MIHLQMWIQQSLKILDFNHSKCVRKNSLKEFVLFMCNKKVYGALTIFSLIRGISRFQCGLQILRASIIPCFGRLGDHNKTIRFSGIFQS